MFRRSIIHILASLFLLPFLPAYLCGQNEPSVMIRESFANATLQQAFDRLEERYDLKIAYEHQAVQGVRVSVRIQAESVDAAFRQLLRDTGLEYQLVGPRRVLVRPKETQTLSGSAPPVEAPPARIRLTGKVEDAFSAAPLPYANVYCSTGQGATTGDDGVFLLELSGDPFPLQLTVSYVGYADRAVRVETTGELDIELIPKIQELAGVDVFEQKPTIAQVSYKDATEVSVQNLYALPSFVGGRDVFRDLQLLPGVSAYDDLSANFSVRGGQESENMIIFDGITLYHVDHYFGIFSALNPNIVDKVTIYKNAFPAEHGGRTASVIDIRSRPLDQRKVNGQAEFNLLTASGFLEIPLGQKAGLLLAGRTTNTNIANSGLFDALEQDSRIGGLRDNPIGNATRNQLTAIEPDFRFYDVNAKLFWQMGDRTTFTAGFFNGYDDFAYRLNNTVSIPLRRGVAESTTSYLETADWRNNGFNLTLEHDWTTDFSSRLNLGRSAYENDNLLNYNLAYQALLRSDSVRVMNHTDNAIRGLNAHLKNTWSPSKHHQVDFGFQLQEHDVDFQFILNDRSILDGDQKAQENALYLQYQARSRDERLHLQIGLRQNFYSLTEKSYFSPRLSASYQLGDRWLVKGAWSKYYQFLRQSTHENALGRTSDFWVLANDSRFPIASSVNTMLGLRFTHSVFDLDVEFYDRKMDGVVEYAQVFTGLSAADGKPPRRNFVFFFGDGRTRGMDVLLKKTTGNYTGWLGYTLSKSTNSFPQIDRGAPFPSQYDRRHQLQLIQQYQWKNWNFALTYVFTSGRPYTDLSLLSGDVFDRRQLTAEDRLSYLEDYHRVDVGANYQFSLWRGQAEIGASIFNLLDRQNVKYRQYIYNLKEAGSGVQGPLNTVLGAELQMLRFTPNVRLSWRF